MRPLYIALADAVVVAHVSYVAFVILGELAILAGILLRLGWIRNRTFRACTWRRSWSWFSNRGRALSVR